MLLYCGRTPRPNRLNYDICYWLCPRNVIDPAFSQKSCARQSLGKAFQVPSRYRSILSEVAHSLRIRPARRYLLRGVDLAPLLQT